MSKPFVVPLFRAHLEFIAARSTFLELGIYREKLEIEKELNRVRTLSEGLRTELFLSNSYPSIKITTDFAFGKKITDLECEQEISYLEHLIAAGREADGKSVT